MSHLDPRLEGGFEALRRDAAAPPRPEAMQAARTAMHQARAAQPQPSGWSLLAGRLRLALTPLRAATAGSSAVAVLAVLATLGWNAPAGSPLHAVRVAHEQLALALPGADRASLELDYAEARLHQVQADGWSSSALDEAASLLADVHRHLDASSPLRPRLQADETLLAQLRRQESTPDEGGAGGTNGDSGSGEGGSATSGDRDSSSSSESTSTSEEGGTSSGEHESSTTTERSSSTSEEGGSSSTTSTESSSTTTDGGGGSDGGGSSSTSGASDH